MNISCSDNFYFYNVYWYACNYIIWYDIYKCSLFYLTNILSIYKNRFRFVLRYNWFHRLRYNYKMIKYTDYRIWKQWKPQNIWTEYPREIFSLNNVWCISSRGQYICICRHGVLHVYIHGLNRYIHQTQ